jgi:hypothetical protein
VSLDEKEKAMTSTTPEYGEQLMIEEREGETNVASLGPLPRWEEMDEAEVVEHERAEEETLHTPFENHAAHRPGAVCDHCGAVIEPDDHARRTVTGTWVHDVCP